MTFDQKLAIWGIAISMLFGIAGVVGTIYAVRDARKERSKRERAVIAARALIERNYGMWIVMKPAAAGEFEAAINDGLAAINAARSSLEAL
ncbi:hypothetical protein EN871_32575 [bacterium M00.F.Ca.ET.228.01.1.1]|nr:hypothetical protein EN871_32575 [bacterium M00.F.Ca.ET.228.01.1.1]TGR95195.1 hypothetical protein EN834_32560 [bacterium M00.F.Ca.ET.191.01.1.1]TGT95992.1 hypothetical protein EN798_32570 [bacterium M00.F.Ca.ET.155.01.1.1]